jgi:putative tryptophan/tyrosine transport system substrate-binding protein
MRGTAGRDNSEAHDPPVQVSLALNSSKLLQRHVRSRPEETQWYPSSIRVLTPQRSQAELKFRSAAACRTEVCYPFGQKHGRDRQVKRRSFITLLAGVAAWPAVARAQQPERMRRIGVLTGLAEDDPENKAGLAAFRQGLEKRGWSEGRNVRIDYRYAPAGAQALVLAKELVALQPDVIFANSTPITAALQHESRTVPIVFAAVADPIGSGFIASLPRPGGNITGVMLFEATVTGKWLAMLKEIAPRLERAAFVMNPKTAPFYNYYLRVAESLSPSLGIKLVPSLVENVSDIERTIEAFARIPNGGLLLPPDSFTSIHHDLIIALAAQYSLPTVAFWRVFVAAGGLMSYGTDFVDMCRQAAPYVDRILRGDKPADLPVQAATKPRKVRHRRGRELFIRLKATCAAPLREVLAVALE